MNEITAINPQFLEHIRVGIDYNLSRAQDLARTVAPAFILKTGSDELPARLADDFEEFRRQMAHLECDESGIINFRLGNRALKLANLADETSKEAFGAYIGTNDLLKVRPGPQNYKSVNLETLQQFMPNTVDRRLLIQSYYASECWRSFAEIKVTPTREGFDSWLKRIEEIAKPLLLQLQHFKLTTNDLIFHPLGQDKITSNARRLLNMIHVARRTETAGALTRHADDGSAALTLPSAGQLPGR